MLSQKSNFRLELGYPIVAFGQHPGDIRGLEPLRYVLRAIEIESRDLKQNDLLRAGLVADRHERIEKCSVALDHARGPRS